MSVESLISSTWETVAQCDNILARALSSRRCLEPKQSADFRIQAECIPQLPEFRASSIASLPDLSADKQGILGRN